MLLLEVRCSDWDRGTEVHASPATLGALDGGGMDAHPASVPTTPVSDFERSHPPVGALLAPSLCRGDRLTVPSAIREAMSQGLMVWHFCYKTPTASSSNSPLAHQRPTTVSALVMRADSTDEVVRGDAPMSANPWTFNILVALAPQALPLFNFRNMYRDGTGLLALDGMNVDFPQQNGTVQSWYVADDGTQSSTPPSYACRDIHAPSRQPTGLVPGAACSEGPWGCPFMYQLDCPHL